MAYHSTVGYFLVETINRIRHLLFSSYTTNDYSSLKPATALYRVRLQLQEPLPVLREQPGRVYIKGGRRSVLLEGGKNLLAVLIRESGF